MVTLGERLPEFLCAFGIDHVFGIPGLHTLEFYRDLPAHALRHVTPRHEQGAGFMADGYARITGRPAACFAITGPGITNIVTAMGQAYGDSVPMLVISSVNRLCELGRGEGRLHELKNQRALVETVSAFSHTVLSPDDLLPALLRAFTLFECSRPRPVHIEIPLDVIATSADHLALPSLPELSAPLPDPELIKKAAAILRGAREPFVVLGGGTANAADEARMLVDRLGAPAVMTVNGKGVLPPGHPLSLGSSLPMEPILHAVRTADVVLAIGTELGETDTLQFGRSIEFCGQVIRIDIDPAQLSRNSGESLGIVADAGRAMSDLAQTLADWIPTQVGSRRAAELRQLARSAVSSSYTLHGRILARMSSALPDAVFVGDSTQPVYGANLTYESPAPRSYFNSSTGFGTLGYALPAAIGAKLARPERSIIALIGDGGFQFSIAELASAVELKLPLPVVVWNNKGYREIKQFMSERCIPEIGVDLHTPDFIAVAKGFGCRAMRISSPEALVEALVQAAQAKIPTVLEMIEDDAMRWEW